MKLVFWFFFFVIAKRVRGSKAAAATIQPNESTTTIPSNILDNEDIPQLDGNHDSQDSEGTLQENINKNNTLQHVGTNPGLIVTSVPMMKGKKLVGAKNAKGKKLVKGKAKLCTEGTSQKSDVAIDEAVVEVGTSSMSQMIDIQALPKSPEIVDLDLLPDIDHLPDLDTIVISSPIKQVKVVKKVTKKVVKKSKASSALCPPSTSGYSGSAEPSTSKSNSRPNIST